MCAARRSAARPTFCRPLLKLSGEVLGGPTGFGFDRTALETSAREIADLVKAGITPSLVLGGGNFFRGARGHLPAVRRHRADFIGMLATVMNALCFAEHLHDLGIPAEVFSASRMDSLCTFYQIDRARDALAAGTVCLFAAGTGAPYFSTDSAAALRAIEVGCDVLIKATKVDGVYDADPVKNPRAKKFDRITYSEVLRRGLGVMDLVAITLCRENRMPLIVLSMAEPGSILRACQGQPIGTRVIEDESN
ncbi:MAG: Uridine monophosphate kinase [Candidatus Ozemobacter sibiricus]|uniref:Uridylate kinase n=1 Tax=Candidatus Ozemobacter sibiricus TaxID=2268124 RepID=A0A367ZRF3_9BACT|nr:MAG: Uridine monophosphate kinase [Candidatus Ozemobacter sibiricus]